MYLPKKDTLQVSSVRQDEICHLIRRQFRHITATNNRKIDKYKNYSHRKQTLQIFTAINYLKSQLVLR